MFGKRLSRALVVTTIASLVMTVAVFADTLPADADALAADTPHGNSKVADQQPGTTAHYAFSAYVAETGNATDDVFPGSLTVTVASTGDWLASVPLSTTSFIFTSYDTNLAGTVSVYVPCGTIENTAKTMSVVLTPGTSTNGKSLSTASVTLTYVITAKGDNDASCTPANTAPALNWTAGPTAVNESGTTEHTYSFSITDPDANTWSFATASDPSCGGNGSLVVGSTSINQAAKTGTFKCKFADGTYPVASSTSMVSVAVSDGWATSNVLTRDVTISNAAPTVAPPAWQSTSVDCRQGATLTNISFSDPGVNDNPWSLSIDFDSNATADYTDSGAAVQGPYANQSTTFNTPGSYTATVAVTDKDGDTGSNSTATALTVNQVYNVTSFYSPLDTSTSVATVKNSFKNGRVVPVKVSLQDGCTLAAIDGNSGVTPTVRLVKTSLNGGTDAVEYFADAGQSSGDTDLMRWSATDGFWIYNLDSKALGLQTGYAYRLDINIGTIKATHTKWVYLAPTK